MPNGIGFLIIVACVFGSFLLSGGKVAVVLEALPHEMVTIGGASFGAFLVANSMRTVKKVGRGLLHAFRGETWRTEDYRDLLALLFGLLTTFRRGGPNEIEKHLDDPAQSPLFSRFPRILAQSHLVTFICDYLRMMTMRFEDPYQIADAMEADIERHHREEVLPQTALQVMADGLPAIGIVAAVLGVIKTMNSIDQPPEILGGMIGGALVGTFLGVLLSYCFVAPLASKLKETLEADCQPYQIVKTAIVAYAQGLPTEVATELARRMMPAHHASSFSELEATLDDVKDQLNAKPQ